MNFRTLDLNLLRVFDVVMVERNVTRSAERLAMTQPAVSNALRRLREAIGEELFLPGPTGVTPTPHAEALWPDVREALDGLRDLFDPQAFDPAHDERSFTLAMADATAAVIVPLWVAEVARAAACVALRVEPLATRDPRMLLERGVADAAVGFFPDVMQELAAAGAQGDAMLDPMYACDYVCAMRRGHPLAAGQALSLDDYCAAVHVRVSFAGRPQGFVDAALAKLGRARRVALVVNHYATAASVVRSSDLLAVFPRRYLPVCGYADDLVWQPLPLAMPQIEIAALWHRRHERDAGHRWLRATLARIAPGEA